MTHTDFLIVGQGIAGTLLSFELMRHGKSVCVIDEENPFKASLVAGAVLNPMAGRHWSPSPQAALFLPKAKETYRYLEQLLDVSVLQETELCVFHESEEKRRHFEEQQRHFPEYFSVIPGNTSPCFKALHGQGRISGVSVVDAQTLLTAAREYLIARHAFVKESFDEHLLEIKESGICYKNIVASRIVFCNGVEMAKSRFFQSLPFTKNRGDVLILDIPGLPEHSLYHRRLRLVPKGDHQFWCGSNYQWDFDHLLPDEKWRNESEAELSAWLKLPFTIKEHIVAERPTTAGQIPVVGIHPEYSAVAALGGLGTRGFSSGPYWAAELAKQLIHTDCKFPEYTVSWPGK